MQIKKVISAIAAAAIVCGAVPSQSFANVMNNSAVTAIAETGENDDAVERTISFNVFEEGITPNRKTDAEDFQTFTTTEDFIIVPIGSFDRDGYFFDGWTIDGVYGFTSGDKIVLKDLPENVVVEPLWVAYSSDKRHTLSYEISYNGEMLERPEWLPEAPQEYTTGQHVAPYMNEIQTDGAFSSGWYMDDILFNYGQKIVMPDHDVVLTPRWIKRISITYFAGDYDRINGPTEFTFPKSEGSSTELPVEDRFSRSGFKLTGWVSSYDGETYAPGQTVKVPSENVTFTAVWSPKEYTVVFKTGVTEIENLKIKGITDSTIKCPSVERSGYTLTGWKYTDSITNETTVYAPGQDFEIRGALPGRGIFLEAIWVKDSVEVTTTTTTKTSTTTSKPTTTTTKSTTTTSKPTTTTTKSSTTTSKPTTTTTKVTSTIDKNYKSGDANSDGEVSLADAVLILQSISSHDKYGENGSDKNHITAQGAKNADVYERGSGLTPQDALQIQKYLSKLITTLE